MKHPWLPAAVVLCALQAAVPAGSIVRYEKTLRDGKPIKLRVEPVDPADAFRGRFVAILPTLIAPTDSIPGAEGIEAWRWRGWAILEPDADGFARVVRVTDVRPEGADALRVRYGGPAWDRVDGEEPRLIGERLVSELDRYYMNERRAPAAEAAYREHASRAKNDAWIAVRLRDGVGVIEGLYVDGRPIEEAARP